VHERWRYGVTMKERRRVQRRTNGGGQTIDINQLGIDEQSGILIQLHESPILLPFAN
jgi:hypothetical protein